MHGSLTFIKPRESFGRDESPAGFCYWFERGKKFARQLAKSVTHDPHFRNACVEIPKNAVPRRFPNGEVMLGYHSWPAAELPRITGYPYQRDRLAGDAVPARA